MQIFLDHTIILARDPEASSTFLSELLGAEPPRRLGHFIALQVGPTSLDYLLSDETIVSRHFAFRVSEALFDSIFARIKDREIPYWADPFRKKPGTINHWDDGRGVYFDDPDGHLMEVITRSYGALGCEAKQPHPLLNCSEK